MLAECYECAGRIEEAVGQWDKVGVDESHVPRLRTTRRNCPGKSGPIWTRRPEAGVRYSKLHSSPRLCQHGPRGVLAAHMLGQSGVSI